MRCRKNVFIYVAALELKGHRQSFTAVAPDGLTSCVTVLVRDCENLGPRSFREPRQQPWRDLPLQKPSLAHH